ncbi:MAG TPA: hypothetical protein VF510_24135 [Ktedonobacterales bacterium]
MAQTSPVRERGQTNNTAKTPTTAKSTSPTTNAEKSATPASAPGKGFLSAMRSFLSAPKTGTDGQKKSSTSKLLRFTLVLVVFMFVIQGLQIGLQYAEQTWHLGLTNYVTSNHTTPIIGGLRWFDLIFFVVVIGFYFALIRFNILPRDLFTAQPRTAAARKASAPIERPAGSGRDRSRAARRRASAVAEAQAAAQAAKNAKGGKKAASAAAPVKETASASDSQVNGEHDDEYYRVKAAQRLQRRRSGKR